MKIIHDYTEPKIDKPIEVVSAEYETGYNIKLFFNDGTGVLIDFEPFLSKSLHPSITKCLDKSLFRNFEIVSGNLNWNDYDLIFPVEDLYKGDIF